MANIEFIRDEVLTELRYAAKAYSGSLLKIESSARQARQAVLRAEYSSERVTGQFFENVARDSARFEVALNLARVLEVDEATVAGIIEEATKGSSTDR